MKKLLSKVLSSALIAVTVCTAYTGNVKAESDSVNDMYRLYNPNSGEHFYTKDANEKNTLVGYGWKYEGVGWVAPSTGDPVYRLYNPNAGDHHYTMSETERDALVKAGWKYEQIGWYSDTSKSVALYRQYNPNAVTGTHNYTTSKAENDALVSYGWKAEGIAWYGVGTGSSSSDSTKTDTGSTTATGSTGTSTKQKEITVILNPNVTLTLNDTQRVSSFTLTQIKGNGSDEASALENAKSQAKKAADEKAGEKAKELGYDVDLNSVKETITQSNGQYSIEYSYAISKDGVTELLTANGDKLDDELYAGYHYKFYEDEESFRKQIKEILDEIDVYDKSEFEQALAVANWMIYNLDFKEKYQGSPKDVALLNTGLGECTSYAALYYRLCRELGLNVEIVTGKLGDTPHTWNSICIDGKWYYADVSGADCNPGTNGSAKWLFIGKDLISSRRTTITKLDYEIADESYKPWTEMVNINWDYVIDPSDYTKAVEAE